ncbi:MAG: hypothetical protein FWD92_04050 [Methanomassiliicoccaceae archaeon]|nr:hypothetical protein [Methanomassiliicoccaceae archaeon]
MSHFSTIGHFVAKIEEFGIKDARKRIDMMLVLDYIIANTDRHYNNFGLIRNADTLEWLSVAPIYDSGTSMWCRDFPTAPNLVRVEGKPFRSTQEMQIKFVKDLSWLDLDTLDGIEDEYAEILSASSSLPPEINLNRNKALCSALRTRINMMRIIADKKADRNPK